MTGFESIESLSAALDDLPQPDQSARQAAEHRQGQLTKPAGSLGRLEEIAVFMAGWQGTERPCIDAVQAIVFAGDHGVAAQGVSAFPPEVTREMVANFHAGGAAMNALAVACGAELSVVDMTGYGPTGDISIEPAMSEGECLAAMTEGAAAVKLRTDLLIVGEMGIGNTTPAAAICAQSLGGNVGDWIGRGSGIDTAGITRKSRVVQRALDLHGHYCGSAFETLRRLGGREIAAMAGAILAARHRRIPVLLDGFICTAAILPFAAADAGFTSHILAAHRSAEASHGRLLDRMGLRPLLDLDMRLGEGTGAAVAVQIVRSALAAHNHMATFEEAGVSGAS